MSVQVKIRLLHDPAQAATAREPVVARTAVERVRRHGVTACRLPLANDEEAGSDEEAERSRLAFELPLAPGAWHLHLRFQGILNDKLRGFYRSTYTDEDGYPAKGGVIFRDSVISTISSTGGGKPVESITFTFSSQSY